MWIIIIAFGIVLGAGISADWALGALAFVWVVMDQSFAWLATKTSTRNLHDAEEYMKDQDRGTPYEEVLARRDRAVARFSLAHQRLANAQLELSAAEEELAVADRELAKAFGLPGTSGVKLSSM